jgi:hypothetical protein
MMLFSQLFTTHAQLQDGLPWLLTGTVMAHELMHAWLVVDTFPTGPKVVEEGLCQLMAYLWLRSQDWKVMVRCLRHVTGNAAGLERKGAEPQHLRTAACIRVCVRHPS